RGARSPPQRSRLPGDRGERPGSVACWPPLACAHDSTNPGANAARSARLHYSRAVTGEGDAPRTRDGERAAIALLAAFGIAALALRLAMSAALPDADTDAYGHFKIGRALLENPADLSVHWVWLPGYH